MSHIVARQTNKGNYYGFGVTWSKCRKAATQKLTVLGSCIGLK